MMIKEEIKSENINSSSKKTNEKDNLKVQSQEEIKVIREEEKKFIADDEIKVKSGDEIIEKPVEEKIEKEIKEDDNKSVNSLINRVNTVFGGLKNLFKTDDKDEKKEEENNFIKFKYDLTNSDLEGRNVLHRTCLNLKRDIVTNLLSQVKDTSIINKLDIYGNTPLILSCKKFVPLNKKIILKSRKTIIENLCLNGANPDCFQTHNQWTAFHWLCFNGDFESIKYLYFRNALFYSPDKDGRFPIDIAGIKVIF